MGYDLYIHGIEPVTDKKKIAMQSVRDACMKADVEEPKEITDVLDEEEMCPRGKIVNINVEDITEPSGEYCQYIDLTKLPHNVKWIRLWHSY